MKFAARRQLVIASFAALGASAAAAQSPAAASPAEPAAARPVIDLSQNDVFFISRWFQGAGSKTWSALCGFAVHGNYLSNDVPRPLWELNIQELMAGDAPVVVISAGTYEVLSQDPKAARQARAPITALSFTVDGSPEPVTARIVGQPGSDNAIKAVVETASGQRLLTGFYDGVPITVSLGYQDGGSEVLRVTNIKDRGHVSGLGGYLQHCTALLHALPPGAPSAYRITSPVDLMSRDPFGNP